MNREGGNMIGRVSVCVCACAGGAERGTQTMNRLVEQVTEY